MTTFDDDEFARGVDALDDADPRRALAALLARHGPTHVDARRHLFTHRHAILGPLGDSDRFVVAYDRGVVVDVGFCVDGSDADVALIDGLAAAGVFRFVRRVRFVGTAQFDKVVRALLAASLPQLRTLQLGPLRQGAGRQLVPLQEVLAAFPSLTTLRLEAPPPPWMPCAHATLQHLTLSAMGTAEPIGFSTTSLPALQSFRFQCRTLCDPQSLATAARRADGSPLELLGLVGVGAFDAWAEASAAGWCVPPKKLHLAEVEKRDVTSTRLAADAVVVIDTLDEADVFEQSIYSPPQHRRRRRFEHDGQFFELWRDATTLGTRQGKIGKNGTTRAKNPGGSEYFVIQEYLKAVAAKRAAGFVEVFVDDDSV
jgi:hypothetical protein